MSNTDVKVYAANQVVLSFCNAIINSGYAKGDFVMIEPNAEDFKDDAGPDGQVCRSETGDKRATIKIKLKHTSDGNSTLNAIRNLDLGTPGGAGIGVLQVRDLNNGKLLFKGNRTWIQKPPSPARGEEVGDVEWTLRTASAEYDFSGYPNVT